MSLFDRLTSHDDEIPTIAVHGFVAALSVWEQGLKTRADLESAFNIEANDPDLDYLVARYQAQTTREDKTTFVARLEHLLILGQTKVFGFEVKANFKATLDLL